MVRDCEVNRHVLELNASDNAQVLADLFQEHVGLAQSWNWSPGGRRRQGGGVVVG